MTQIPETQTGGIQLIKTQGFSFSFSFFLSLLLSFVFLLALLSKAEPDCKLFPMLLLECILMTEHIA